MSKFKSKGGRERYVMLRYWLLDSAAWKSLPVGAQALYVDIARRYNGSNNGRIPYSVRDGVKLGVSRGQAKYLLDMLLDRGFIVCTRKGYFNLKATKDASEWRLTEYASDHPVEHATKEFMRWNGDFESVSQFRERKGERRPKMTGADKERARQSQKIKTRLTAMNRTVHSDEPHGSQQKTVKPKKRPHGSQQWTVNAQNAPLTVHSNGHLQLPGSGRCGAAAVDRSEVGIPDGARPLARLNPYTVVAKNGARVHWVTARDTFPDGEAAPKKPWTTPTIEEIPWDTAPAELRMMALSLPVPAIEPEPKPKYRPEELAF